MESQAHVTIWQGAKDFFEFYLASVVYLVKFAYNFTRVAIPLVIKGTIWILQTIVRLILLFFALILLIIGPYLRLPSAIYQSVWRLLVNTGAVTPTSVARVARQATSAAAAAAANSDDPAATASMAGPLVRMAYQRMDIVMATTIVSDTMQGVVSELFWAVVDTMGLGAYFRNVARHKELLRRQQDEDYDSDEGIEEVYNEEEELNGIHRRRGQRIEDEPLEAQGRTVAMVLHQAQTAGEWTARTTQRWWHKRQEARRRRKQEKMVNEAISKREKAAKVLEKWGDELFEAEADASYAVKLALQSVETSNFWSKETADAEKLFDKAVKELELAQKKAKEQPSEINEDKGTSWWFRGPTRTPVQLAEESVARAEAWLIEANSEATICMKLEERRKKEQVEAFEKVRIAEREQEKADQELKAADTNLLHVLETVGKEVIIRGEDDSASVTSSTLHQDDIHSRASVVSHDDYGDSAATSAEQTPAPSHHGDSECHPHVEEIPDDDSPIPQAVGPGIEDAIEEVEDGEDVQIEEVTEDAD